VIDLLDFFSFDAESEIPGLAQELSFCLSVDEVPWLTYIWDSEDGWLPVSLLPQ
jgi:hypothetical protein